MILIWSFRNVIGDGVFERINGGLIRFGVEVVGKVEELGIVVDFSYINEVGFWDMFDVIFFFVIVFYLNVRVFCDSFRNLIDE